MTTVPRTVIDLAAIVSAGRLQYVVDSALRKQLTTAEEIEQRLEAMNSRGRRGTATLRALLREASTNAAPQSTLERRFIELANRAGLPHLHRQYEIDIGWARPIHVDFAHPQLKLAIETDGYATHSNRQQWELDRRRDAVLVALGWVVLRFSWRDVDLRPDYVLSTIETVVRERRRAS